MFGVVTGKAAGGSERLNVKLENIEEETVALKPASLTVVKSAPKAAGGADGGAEAEGVGAVPAKSWGALLHYGFRGLARGIPMALWWYKSFMGTTSAKDAGMKNMVQKYAGAACTVLYVQVRSNGLPINRLSLCIYMPAIDSSLSLSLVAGTPRRR